MPRSYLLSATEQLIVADKEWLYAKHRIISKVYDLFGDLSSRFSDLLAQSNISKQLTVASPKIYKGEQYQKLPYVMLDQPRHFRGSDAFAIRSLFWWGEGFSIHLVLGGELLSLLPLIRRNSAALIPEGWSYKSTNDPWHHHFESDNYSPLSSPDLIEVGSNNYFKLGKHIPIDQWAHAEMFFLDCFQQLTGLF